jgi:hypothetical protein
VSGRDLVGIHSAVTGDVVAHAVSMRHGCAGLGGGGFLGMSAEVLLGTYGHHHPDFLHGAANAVTSKHRVSVVSLENARERGQNARK